VDNLIGKRSSLKWSSKFFSKLDLISFALSLNDIDIIHGQTQYNCILGNDIVKIHGDPTINHRDWVVVNVNDTQVLCHVLCFVCIENVRTNKIFATGTVDRDGLYAICHYVNQNVFSDIQPSDDTYGHGNFVSYRVDENCDLIRGWPKFTEEISSGRIPRRKPTPTLAMFPVESIVSTCLGIEDSRNPIPHSYIFIPARNTWPQRFKKRMIDLMMLEGEYFNLDGIGKVTKDNDEEDDDDDNDEDDEDDDDNDEEDNDDNDEEDDDDNDEEDDDDEDTDTEDEDEHDDDDDKDNDDKDTNTEEEEEHDDDEDNDED